MTQAWAEANLEAMEEETQAWAEANLADMEEETLDQEVSWHVQSLLVDWY